MLWLCKTPGQDRPTARLLVVQGDRPARELSGDRLTAHPVGLVLSQSAPSVVRRAAMA
jgi:hypothetical protein